MTKLRRYCWRVGASLDLAEGEACPECGVVGHFPLEDQSTCGGYVSRPPPGLAGYLPVGVRCFLPIGHAGACASEASTLGALEDEPEVTVRFVDDIHDTSVSPIYPRIYGEDGNE